ncbi:NAD dependent epimerase/dehydratase family protein [Bordetella ansorpii]|uniref:NAD dependent epimerase/dehydratase family protein n=1 Tax=Bordetella ansorpii TaxID=288768 RepID=A0A157L4Q4_9BORD|nr:NAD(P)-dependent oxidoreductase [Bordetella ansorpii]SAH91406.1 NAD dependent epimerase/dehydratase family protein [Bordetella ansorpii]
MSSIPRFNRLLLTGAAGGVGRAIRPRLAAYARHVRLSDLPAALSAQTEPLGPHEEALPCDISDRAAFDALVQDCDAIVHLGGVSIERPFEEILEANIKGVFNLYEAARRHGVQRIVFASSNHVTGFYRQDEVIDTQALRRPDGYYGVSKSFGEDMAQLYFDRYGIETVSIRIGSLFPEPVDRRMMASWISLDDFDALLHGCLFTPDVGHTVVYGMSANKKVWWDNRHAARLGYAPQDTSEVFRAKIDAQPAPAPDDPAVTLQGGKFTVTGPFDPQ